MPGRKAGCHRPVVAIMPVARPRYENFLNAMIATPVNRERTQPPRRRRCGALAPLVGLLCACLVSGCYSSAELLQRVRNDAMKNRVEEIDLGRFSITMPRDQTLAETLEIDMHVFGTIARYKREAVELQLAEDEHLFRHRTLMAIRDTTAEDFTDPDLEEFRKKILTAANSVLEEPTIKQIGFHEVRFMRN